MRGPYRKRRIELPPRFTHFKPAGIPAQDLQVIILALDEFEAIRLADQQGLDHQQAADMMCISRPTFSRLIERARNKVASAIIEGLAIRIEGGHVDFPNQMLECEECGDVFSGNASNCPGCGSDHLHPWQRGGGHGRRRGKGGPR